MESVFEPIISGMLVPWAAPLFTRAGFSRKVNVMIVMAICIVVAAVQQQLAGNLNLSFESGAAFLESLGIIVTVSQGFYRPFKEPIEGLEGGVESLLAARMVPKTEGIKPGAKVLLTDEIERQIEKQINERITRIMGVKDTAPTMSEDGEEVLDDYEPIAG